MRERLSRMSEASLRFTEDLDFNSALQGVLDSARSLTGARYGVIALHDDDGAVEGLLSSGMTSDESDWQWKLMGWPRHSAYLSKLSGPLRIPDLFDHFRLQGLPELRPIAEGSDKVSFLAFPVLHRGERLGSIYLAQKEHSRDFTQEDEEALALFACQAAMGISNARLHREARRARTDLETLINASPVGVIVFDTKSGNPKSFNREAMRMVDILRTPDQTPEQLLEVISFTRSDGREISLQEFQATTSMSTGEKVPAEEIVVGVPDGRSVSVLVSATPVIADGSEVESVVFMLQDMATLKDMERMRAEFLELVSHELRAPLASIRGSATSILDASSELDPAELRQFLRIIVDQSDDMRDLIGDLLDLARIESGALSIGPEPTAVSVLVDRARNTFLGARGNILQIDVETDLPMVLADRRRIVQVISILLSNAARNSPEGSLIRLGAVQDGIQISVSVTYEGRGVPEEQYPQLFRTLSQTTSDGPGRDSGLGLAICKGIVEAHGGRIWAESEGTGLRTRFTFTIPAVEDTVAYPDTFGSRVPDKARVSEPVLVVNDDPLTLMHLRSALSGSGYTPIVTTSAEEALRLLVESRPHLVMLDLRLPDPDGIELMGEILAIADVPVLFVSAHGGGRTIAKALSKGASDYIVRPFSPAELDSRVKAAVGRPDVTGKLGLSEAYVVGDLRIDHQERRVTLAESSLKLTATEYRLLYELSVRRGRVVTHDHLLRRVWPPHKSPNIQTLRTHIRRLRKKLGENGSNPRYIITEPRVGYHVAWSDTSEEK